MNASRRLLELRESSGHWERRETLAGTCVDVWVDESDPAARPPATWHPNGEPDVHDTPDQLTRTRQE